jgi:hypothetical protein
MKVTLGKYKKNGSDRTEKIQIDKWDTWNLDCTLAAIIHPALIQLRDNTHGHPGTLRSMKQWTNILNKMIFAFDSVLHQSEIDDTFSSGDMDIQYEKLENGMTKTSIGPKSTWKFNKKARNQHYKKVQEGLDLFAKYYMGLWD